MPKENLSAGVGAYASVVTARRSFLRSGGRLASAGQHRWSRRDVPFCGVAAGWRLWARIGGHGETFLSAERRPRLAWTRTKLWSGVDASGEPAVPAGRGVPQRGEALPDAGLDGTLVALGG